MSNSLVRTIALSAIVLSGNLSTAQAAVTYHYAGSGFDTPQTFVAFVGSNPYTVADSFSGSFTVASALAPSTLTSLLSAQYSFSDGIHTFNNATSIPRTYFSVATDASGNIANWFLNLQLNAPSVIPAGTVFAATCNTGGLVSVGFTCNFDKGQISQPGTSIFTRGTTSHLGVWTVSAVPEPETFVMLLAGLGVVGALVRRRRASSM
jgi:hypothetical protein